MRKLIRATLGLAFLATTANAASILEFSQSTPGTAVTSANSGNNTTISANPGTTVLASKVGGVQAPPSQIYTEAFSFTSNTAPSGSGGNISQGGFSGLFTYVNPQNGNTVAGRVDNATLSIVTNGSGGTTANFNASQVTFSNISPAILQAAFGTSNIPLGTLIGNFSLTLNDLNPTNPNSLSFQASAGGIITANVVPEPTSIVIASMALVAGLGGVGLRRIKASRA